MKKELFITFLLLVIGFALLINVGSFGVVESSDARYAEIAREMYSSNDYLHPNLLNIHHYHKPPFTYQITALAYNIFGVNPFAARFFLQLSVLLQFWLVFQIGLLLFSSRNTALYTVIIYASFPLLIISSRNLTTDSFLTTFALLSIFSWLKYVKNHKTFYLYLFALALGLGFYTKGPVIFIAPVIFMIVYKSFNKDKYRFSIHHFLASLLFLIIGFWWYTFLIKDNPEFLDYFLGKQTIERFSKNAFDRTEPFWYFILFAPLVGAPWLLMLPYLLKVTWKSVNTNKIVKILVLSILIPIIFFSMSSSKRILYILPLYGFMALLTSYLLTFINENEKKVVYKSVFAFYSIMLIAIIVASFLSIDFYIPFIAILISAAVLLLLIGILISPKINSDHKPMASSLIMTVFLLIMGSYLMSENQLKINSSKPVSDFIRELHPENKEILIYNSRKPSIAFELDRDIISIYKSSHDLNRETQFEKDLSWKEYLININIEQERKDLLNKIENTPTILVSYKASDRDTVLQNLTRFYKNQKKLGKYTVYY